MAVVWYEKNPGATEEEIRTFEAKEQIVLPESYKAFLRQMDGGSVSRGHIPFLRPNKDVFSLETIYSLADISRTLSNLRRRPPSPIRFSILDEEGNEYEEEEIFPRDLLPIGSSGTGHDLLALRIASGAIYLWFDDWFDEADRLFVTPDIATFIHIAHSSIEEDML